MLDYFLRFLINDRMLFTDKTIVIMVCHLLLMRGSRVLKFSKFSNIKDCNRKINNSGSSPRRMIRN